jgi:serine/threonine protein kinase/tetratricopeptide (TPR) repeat protein
VKAALVVALELTPAGRAEYLAGVCAGDQPLRDELERLLMADEIAGPLFLARPAMLPDMNERAQQEPDLWIGRRVGAYEIVEQIGVGGMGEVYRAVRADDQYRSQVAIKLVRAGQGSSFVVNRFRAERQILANLDHPNIAKILDGGTTADGLPYFVMELIDGLTITEYCDEHELDVDARVQLLRTVCSAVQYAHQHLTIHRDIKPSNILISAEGVPKLLDFGIAKILDPNDLPENAAVTVAGGWLTPEYASPEQLRGEAITTATDVYALGLVLYQLLARRQAYRFESRTPHEMARAVVESEPEKPSAAVRRVGPELVSWRGDSPEKLRRRLAGDLDNIVMKAIRKEPRERYDSVDHLSEDLRRHLEGLPVTARKSTVGYRCRKFVSRHKAGVIAAALVLLSLISGLVLTLREARIARANEVRAEKRFNDVRKLANSLIFEIHDSVKDLAGATPTRKLLVERALEYLDSLAQEAGGDRSLQLELAGAYGRLGNVQGSADYANLGDTPGALASYRKALAIQESLLKDDPANSALQWELFFTYSRIGYSLQAESDFPGALANLRKALEIAKRSAGSTRDPTLSDRLAGGYYGVAGVLTQMGDLSGALANYRTAALIRQSAQGATSAQSATLRTHLAGDYGGMAVVHGLRGDGDAAIEAQQQATALVQELSKAEPTNATLRNFLGQSQYYTAAFLVEKGQLDQALSHYRSAHDIFQGLSVADPSDAMTRRLLGFSSSRIGDVLVKEGQPDAGLENLRRALAIFEGLSARVPMNNSIRSGFADTYAGMGAAYVALAVDPGIPAAPKLDDWRMGRENYLKSLNMWSDIQARGGVVPEDAAKPGTVREAIAACDAALDGVGARR